MRMLWHNYTKKHALADRGCTGGYTVKQCNAAVEVAF